MQIAVLGLGRFGAQLARTLSMQGNEVLAIDQNDAEVQSISEITARAAIADITDVDALRDLGVPGVDIAVVGTAELEASVLATMNLQSLGVTPIYAKARSDRHATILRRIGADRVVQPEKDGGERFAHLIRVKAAADYLTLSDEYGVGVYEVPSQIVGKRLEDLQAHAGTRRLLMVVRNNEVQLNPVRSQTIEANDKLVFAGADDDLAREL